MKDYSIHLYNYVITFYEAVKGYLLSLSEEELFDLYKSYEKEKIMIDPNYNCVYPMSSWNDWSKGIKQPIDTKYFNQHDRYFKMAEFSDEVLSSRCITHLIDLQQMVVDIIFYHWAFGHRFLECLFIEV